MAATTVLALLASASACRTARDQVQAGRASLGDRIDAAAEEFLGKRRVPGMAICALKSGNLLHEGYYGLEGVGPEDLVDRATRFDLGSIKKHVTAAAIVRLAEQGRLGLDDPLTRWLPRFPVKAPVIRLHDMMHQVSGLPDEAGMAGPIDLDFEPGTDWAYSNANFDLLDLVVEAADGRPFARFLTEELVAPLHLEALAMCGEGGEAAATAVRGHTVRGGTIVSSEEPCWFAGSAIDLATWMDALMRGRVVSEAGVRAMTTPARLTDGSERPYGFGLDLRPYRGMRKVWHTGHAGGCAAAVAYYPDEALTIAVAANSDALFDPESIEMRVARLVLGLPEPEVEEIGVDDEDLERFSGVFDARSVWFRLGPSEDGRRLSMTMQGPADGSWEYVSQEMLRIGEREFVARDAPEAVRVRFAGDREDGGIHDAQVDMVGVRWHAVRR